MAKPDCVKIVDPAMADHGVLYTGFDAAFAKEMAGLCGKADVVLPNITEAAMMVDMPFVASGYDEAYIKELMEKVLALGAGAVVLTGVSYREGELGVAVLRRGDDAISYYFHERLAKNSHGTGDIFASAFTGALMRGKTMEDAAKIAADFTLLCIKETLSEPDHWYGVKFEPMLGELIKALK